MLWSEAAPALLAAALDKLGITTQDLRRDLQDAYRDKPALEAEFRRRKYEGQVKLALEWFGDLGNPQPTERTTWSEGWPGGPPYTTPDWPNGRLPRSGRS